MRDPRIVEAASQLITKYGFNSDRLSVKMPQAILIHIASCIRSWSDIAPYLGFAIEDFEEVFQSSGSEKSKKLFVLEKWSNKMGEEATFSQLIEIFLVAERQDLAERVCEYYAIWNKEQTHQKIHHPLMYTRRGRPTKKFDLTAAQANMISKPRPLINGNRVTVFKEVRQNGSHDPAAVRVIQIEDDSVTGGRGKRVKRRCAQGCAQCVYCFVLLLFGLLSAAALTLAYTIVTPLPHPPEGMTLLKRDNPVFVGRLKPFYTESADISILNKNSSPSFSDFEENGSAATSFTVDVQNNAHPIVIEYYQMKCNELRTLNTTVEVQGIVNISEGHTHTLYEEYLVEGSIIHFQFHFGDLHSIEEHKNITTHQQRDVILEEIVTRQETTPTDKAISVPIESLLTTVPQAVPMTSECLTELHIFNNSIAESTTENKESSMQPQTVVCIQNVEHNKQQKQTFNFTFSALHSSHQTIKVRFKSVSDTLQTGKSLNYEISGTKLTFDLEHYWPTCTSAPSNQSSCTLRFSNYRIYRYNEEECVLGQLMGSDTSSIDNVEIEYWTRSNRYVKIMHYALVGLGLAFLIVFSGFISGCISLCKCG